jgi:uracil phosphoribosyltransferase
MDKNVVILDHPLIQHKVSLIRDIRTGSKDFRELVEEIALLMCNEATRDLPLREVEIETPVAVTKTKVIAGKKLAVVPVLRAGLGMVDGMLKLLPTAKVGHIGVYRNPETLEPVEYYCKLPFDIEERDVIVLDPMLATAVPFRRRFPSLSKGCKSIKTMSIVAAPEGIKKLRADHPDVTIYCADLDEN